MTAEIAILNKSAAALAADSAVTIGRGASAKIYNTVNKIFELHEAAPVGIMIYGRLDFMGLPLETLIKKYRREQKATFPKIKDYKDHFVNWLSSEVPYKKEDEDSVVLMVAVDLLEDIGRSVESYVFEEINKRAKYLKSKDNGIAQKVIKKELAEIKQKKRMPYASAAYLNLLHQQFDPVIERAVSYVIDRMTPNQQTKKELGKLVIEALSRRQLSSFRTGVVIAGFGEAEICPSLERFEMEGVVGGQLKVVEGDPVDIDRRGPHAEVLGFAQSDMIERFLHGIDPQLFSYSASIVRQSILEIATEVIAAFTTGSGATPTLPPGLAGVIQKIQSDQLKKLEEHRDNEYTKPIKDMIRHMPKQEIANLAKALIELTSLKRKVSREQETVGGDVDVAVISKSEGFVWVQRKHYFPADLNSRFFAHHYRQ